MPEPNAEIEPLELLEDRVDGGGTGRWRAHTADAIAAVRAAQLRPLLGLVGGDVGHRHCTGPRGLGGDFGGDLGRMSAAVEPFGAVAGDLFQGFRELTVAQQRTDGPRLAGLVVEDRLQVFLMRGAVPGAD